MSESALRAACHEAIEVLEQWIKVAKPDQGTLGTRITINRIKKAIKEPHGPQDPACGFGPCLTVEGKEWHDPNCPSLRR